MRHLLRGSKKGANNASGAAVLIVLIALLIILYVLFLPPDSRCELLDTCGASSGGGSGGSGGGGGVPNLQKLHSFVPGTMQEQAPRVSRLPSFTVETQTSGNLLADRSGMTVSRSVFHDNEERMRFSVPPSADNVFLSFSALEAAGDLQIDLNGRRIFDSPITQRQPAPVSLDAVDLQEENELVFGVSGVGFSFWETNAYELANVRVTADVTTFQDASQQQRFVISDLEDAEAVMLSFTPDCFETIGEGRLTVTVNSAPIYIGRPECGVPFQTQLALNRVSEGENLISWSTDAGSYIIDQPEVAVTYEATEQQQPLVISQELLGRAASEGGDVLLRLSFSSPGSEGRVSINGRELAFRTHRRTFDGPITPYVRAGENTIRIASSTTPVTLVEVLYG